MDRRPVLYGRLQVRGTGLWDADIRGPSSLRQLSRLWAALAVAAAAYPLTTSFGYAPQSSIGELVAEYRRRDADAAVEALSQWSAERLIQAGDTEAFSDPWDDNALALLHVEAGLRRGAFLVSPSAEWRTTRPDAVHGGHAVAAGARALRKRTPGTAAGLEVFARLLEIVIGSVQNRLITAVPDAGKSDVLKIAKAVPPDASLRLFAGSMLASVMGPQVQEQSGYHRVFLYGGEYAQDHGLPAQRHASSAYGVFDADVVANAEKALREAIRFQPDLTEARLRLGHLLMLVGRTNDARRELMTASAQARTANQGFQGYLAELFVGQMLEREGRLREAAHAFAAASAFKPLAPAARVALGQSLLSAGFLTDGWAAIRQMFGDERREGVTEIDPWVWFPHAQFWRVREDLGALRTMVRVGDLKPPKQSVQAVSTLVSPLLPLPEITTPTSGSLAPLPQPGFTARVEGVRVDVVVTSDGQPVTGLRATDFEVIDNGVAQTIEAATSVNSLSVGLVIDTSYSAGAFATPTTTLASGVLDLLKSGDRCTVVGVDDAIALIVPLVDISRAPMYLPRQPRRVVRTALWDAALASASLVADERNRPVVVVISDMADNASWSGQNYFSQRPRVQRDRIAEAFRASGIVLDLIALPEWNRQRATDGLEPYSMSDVWVGNLAGPEMAELTGGVRLAANDPRLRETLRIHFDRLRAGYVLTFQPKGVRSGDGWHRLTVRVRGNRRVDVAARAGYYSPAVPR